MLSAVTVILLLLQFGADSVLSQLINDKEYRDILEALVAGHTKATWTSVDTLLRQTTPKLYSNLSEKVHGFRSNMLLVGPNTSSADMFVLQGLSKFVVPLIEVRMVTYDHTTPSLLLASSIAAELVSLPSEPAHPTDPTPAED